jgi:glycosyltransferase involved in cell wall biosynthesis
LQFIIIFVRFYPLILSVLLPSIICFLILGIQLVYLLLFLIAFSKKRTDQTSLAQPVSIIVCAHDEEHNLRESVPLLLAQDYPIFELIIVEDRCNDGTYDYLLQATKEHETLKMVRVVNKPEHVNGKKFGLTLGIKAAKYDWVLFTDADCRPHSTTWIKEMAAPISGDKKIVLGFSPYRKSPGFLNAFIRFESFLTGIQFIGLALLAKPYMGVGRNLLYHKSLFLTNKGFNRHLGITGGDDDLFVNQHATNKNTTVALGSAALTFSIPKTTWQDFYYQKLRHLSVGKHYRFGDRLMLGLFSLSWLAVWLLAIPLAFYSPFVLWIAGLLLLRSSLLILLFYRAARTLGEPFELWAVPILDFVYTFYYLVAGTAALTAKRIPWKRK